MHRHQSPARAIRLRPRFRAFRVKLTPHGIDAAYFFGPTRRSKNAAKSEASMSTTRPRPLKERDLFCHRFERLLIDRLFHNEKNRRIFASRLATERRGGRDAYIISYLPFADKGVFETCNSATNREYHRSCPTRQRKCKVFLDPSYLPL